MPNLAFHTEVLNQVIAKEAAAGNDIAKKINAPGSPLKKFAMLGVMGPDIFRYTPASRPLATFLHDLVLPANGKPMSQADIESSIVNKITTSQPEGLEIFFNPIGSIYSVLFSTVVIPVWPK